ncbi:MAG: zinc ribbon domain-containing protein [Deltaproteobacteria bacterium]|nr:zinc ribbon domain-containing protein [Deltaproteobacteria bacterium]MBZ0220643.1 zinc ribbon domain-containing protein [Deltaproteobacteria bacterium]
MAEILPGPVCHSCGMLIMNKDEFGCEANLTVMNTFYCRYCYWKGQFTEPDITKEEMLEKLSSAMMTSKNISKEEASEMAWSRMKLLKRWKGK